MLRLEMMSCGWRAVRVETGFVFAMSACARQAATVHGVRAHVSEAVKMVGGEWVECSREDLDRCTVDPDGWTCPHHGWTHASGPVVVDRQGATR